MSIVIAGYRGLIGHAIAQGLQRHDVRTLGRDAKADIRCDLNQVGDLAGVLQGTDVFIHAAGVVDEELQGDRAAAAITRSTLGVQSLLTQLQKAKVGHMVYVSSAHVYGPLEGTISEETPAAPVSQYAQLHRSAEQHIEAAIAGGALQSALIIRPNAVYGLPSNTFRRWSLIPYAFPREAVEKQSITLQSAGLQKRNFVSTAAIGEHVNQYVARLLQKQENGLTLLNPLGPETLSVIDFARRVAGRYRDRFGRDCAVHTQTGATAEPAAFTYASGQKLQPPGQPLDAFIDELFTVLEKSHAA